MKRTGWRDKSVLVTGGAGFLGSHLVEALLAKGARVTVLDYLENPHKLKHLLPRIHYLKGDIAEWEGSLEGEAKAEVIYHLAAFASPSTAQAEPETTYRWNVRGTANLLGVARRWGVKKFIFPSAGALYGAVPKYLPIDEKHPIDSEQGIYVTTKRIGEFLCEEFHRNYGVPTLYFRLFNTFGPRQSLPYLVPSLFVQGLEKGSITVQNGKIVRDFTYVKDMVEAFIKGAESDYCGGPINLGFGKEHSVEEVARKIADFLKVEVHFLSQEVFGPTRAVCDNSLAKKVLDWQPAYSFEEGLELTLKSFREEFGGARAQAVTASSEGRKS